MRYRQFRAVGALLFINLFGLVTSAFSQNLSFQLLHQVNGATQENFGYAVAGVGDVNGDGNADFIVGSYTASPGGIVEAGSVYLYSGRDGSLLRQVNGEFPGGHFGYSVAGGADIDGDGKPDFIVGAPNVDSDSSQAGAVYVYSGATGALLQVKFGSFPSGHLGTSVGMIKDLNSDGKDEYMAGAPRANPGGQASAGSVYLYSGSDGTLIYEEDGGVAADAFGASLADAGDVNGDGKDDFIVGAPYVEPPDSQRSFNSGAAYVFSGFDGSKLFSVFGESADDYLGWSVAGAGDVNGDGKADFIVGSPNKDIAGLVDAGWAGVYSGRDGSLIFSLAGDSAGALFGFSVAGAGDVDGDGRSDVIIGAIGARPNGIDYAGSAYVISGANGSTLFRADGSGILDDMGYRVAAAGDVNGDGRPDVIASALFADSGRGAVFIYGMIPTNVTGEKSNRPARFELAQNYPNPFNPATTIRFYLPEREKIVLDIFNVAGQRVARLLEGEESAGQHTLAWDGRDSKGRTLPSGVYFYRLRGENFSDTKKMLLLK